MAARRGLLSASRLARGLRAACPEQVAQSLACLDAAPAVLSRPPASSIHSVAGSPLLFQHALAHQRDSALPSAAAAPAAAAHRPSQRYNVEIVTGSVRGAGSPTPAIIQLIGEEGESDPYLIGSDGEQSGFDESSQKTYIIHSPSLGQLRQVLVRQLPPEDGSRKQDDDDADAQERWFLERVVVVDPEGESFTFPCGEWLGHDLPTQSLNAPARVLVPHSVQLSSLRDPRYGATRALHVATGGFSIPHPDKVEAGARGVNRREGGWGGEDAYFVARAPGTGVVGLGVSDGVYAWRQRGVDAGAFSRGLMAGAARAVVRGADEAGEVLRAAAADVAAAGTRGSATACVVLIGTVGGVLSTANLGDSGWLLLSAGGGAVGPAARRAPRTLRARSPQQEHTFGYPFQLGSQESADGPGDAMLTTLAVRPGNVLVLGSDGLFDNLEDATVVAAVDAAMLAGEAPAAIARRLVYAALAASGDKKGVTPYSRAASDAFDLVFSGGKQDDITAVVAVIA